MQRRTPQRPFADWALRNASRWLTVERQHGLAHASPELPGLVTELLVWLPDVVVVSGTPAALAVRQALARADEVIE